MPLYEYKFSPDKANQFKGCPACRKGFEIRQELKQDKLTKCPICKGPLKKIISKVTKPEKFKPKSLSEIKSAGFQIYEKRDPGVYEKL